MEEKFNFKPIVTKEEYDSLIMDNLDFAYSVVAKEFSKYTGKIREDLNSAALLGLVYAAGKFDPAKNCKFITYAAPWIRYYVNEEIRKMYPVKLNQNFITKRNKILKAIEEYKKKNDGNFPPMSFLTSELNLSERQINSVLKVNGGTNFSFIAFGSNEDNDEGKCSNSDDKLMYEYISKNSVNEIEKQNDIKDCRFILATLKNEVPENEYNMFIDCKINEMSLTDIAKKYNMKHAANVEYIIKKLFKKCQEIAKVGMK